MNTGYRPTTEHQKDIWLDVFQAAWVEGKIFTFQGFCQRYGYTDNAKTREQLNNMVKAGVLFASKVLFDDGKYRKCFTAQMTKRLPFIFSRAEPISLEVVS